MANTLTNLIPILHKAVDVVSRELTGMIPSVTFTPGADMAAVGQKIYYPIVGAGSPTDIASSATGPDPSDHTVANDYLEITKSQSDTFYYTGEEQLGLGGLYDTLVQNQFAQKMRALVNAIEGDLTALQSSASRAYAAHATTPVTPFANAGDFTDLSNALKIIKDNGAPTSDLRVVLNTTAGANLLGKQSTSSVDFSGDLLRQGILLSLFGAQVRESSAIVRTSAVGNNTGTYAANGAHAVGATEITVKTGTGTILAGDVITFSSDTSIKYVVKTGVDNGTKIVLRAPGLVKALAGNESVAVVGTCARNMVFSQSAIHLVTRTPAMPMGGDAADDVMNITDPVSGLTFQVAMYRQRRRVAYEVGISWGVKAVKSEHIALLLGQ